MFLADSQPDEIIKELDSALQQGAISQENYNLAKNSLGDKYAKESDPEKLVSLLLQYSKIAESTDAVKAQRDFRNEVLIQKADLSESHFKQFLQWTGSKQLENNVPKMSGLKKFIDAMKAGFKSGVPPLAVKSLYDMVNKYMGDKYTPGQKVSKGGRQFEVVKQDDGSIGFK